jgi:hypothetical protein
MEIILRISEIELTGDFWGLCFAGGMGAPKRLVSEGGEADV